MDAVELQIPEAQRRLDTLKALDESDINRIIENMLIDEPEIAVALTSLVYEEPVNEVLVKRVSSKGEVTRIKDRKTR
ncbi:prohead core protein, partial [Klebsiella pneumoniae]|nr:prohead core protein [Klebsiella pneumoniae]